MKMLNDDLKKFMKNEKYAYVNAAKIRFTGHSCFLEICEFSLEISLYPGREMKQ